MVAVACNRRYLHLDFVIIYHLDDCGGGI